MSGIVTWTISLLMVFVALPAARAEEGERVIRRELELSASLEQVWDAWTTDAGAQRFFAARTHIEPRLGGAYEIWFVPENPAGLRGCDGCRVHSITPRSVLRFTWNAPPRFAIRDLGLYTLVTLRFDEIAPGRVRLSLSQTGWGDGPEWDAVHEYFSSAWDVVLDRFARSLATEVDM